MVRQRRPPAYVLTVLAVGMMLAYGFVWSEHAFYPHYAQTAEHAGRSVIGDQSAAGAVMLVERSVVIVALLGWLLARALRDAGRRQELAELAARHGVALRTIAAGGRVGDSHGRLRDLRDRYADAIRERYPDIPRRISGYNLDRLLPENGLNLAAALVGTEATCGLVLETRCTLIESPQHRSLVLLGYDDAATAAGRVPEIMEYGPIGLETFDRGLLDNEPRKGFKRHPELLPAGDSWLLVEFGGADQEESGAQAERLMRTVKRGAGGPYLDAKLYEDESEVAQVWEIREGGVGNSLTAGGYVSAPDRLVVDAQEPG